MRTPNGAPGRWARAVGDYRPRRRSVGGDHCMDKTAFLELVGPHH